MKRRSALLILANCTLIYAGSITIERPITLTGSSQWMIDYRADGTWSSRAFWLDGTSSLNLNLNPQIVTFSDYFSGLPTGVTFSSLSARMNITSESVGITPATPSGVSMDLRPGSLTGTGVQNLGTCLTDFHIPLDGNAVDMTSCLSQLLVPSATLRFGAIVFAGSRPFSLNSVSFTPAVLAALPSCCGSTATAIVGESDSGTMQLTFGYNDPPNNVPEPATAFGALTALAVIVARRHRSAPQDEQRL